MALADLLPSTSTVLTTLFLCIFIARSIQVALFSPLSKIPPAHFLAPFTSLWILWRRRLGSEYHAVHAAHLSDGPIVRLGPNEIAINKVDDGIAVVHGTPGFDKTQWYDFFVNHGRRNAFSTYTPAEHTRLRKRSAYVYSKSFVQTNILALDILTEMSLGRYISAIEATLTHDGAGDVSKSSPSPPSSTAKANGKSNDSNNSGGGGILDVFPLNLAYGLDVVTTLLWGWGIGTEMLQDVNERDAWASRYQDAHSPPGAIFRLLELPRLTSLLGSVLEAFSLSNICVPQRMAAGRKWLETWALKRVRDFEDTEIATAELWEKLNRKRPEMTTVISQIKKNLLAEQYGGVEAAKSKPQVLNEEQLLEAASECLDHIYATRDTFGITLTYILFALSKWPSLQDRLHVELSSSLPEPVIDAIESRSVKALAALAMDHLPARLESLPVLNAIIREGLRLRNIPPLAQPRFVSSGPPVHLCGFDIPAGTKISCFATSTHNMPSVFTGPEHFNPDRWLQRNQAKVRSMEKSFWPMGMGSRVCLGQHLAMEMLRFALATTYLRYATEIVDDKDFGDGGGWVTGSPSERLVLRFTARSEEEV